MRSYFSKFINRKHEQVFLNIICDFVGGRLVRMFRIGGRRSHISDEFWRLRIFVTKRRQLGKIYVEISDDNRAGCWSNKKPRRMYLDSFNWRPVLPKKLVALLCRVDDIRTQLLGQQHFSIPDCVSMTRQIEVCVEKSVEDYLLEKTRALIPAPKFFSV